MKNFSADFTLQVDGVKGVCPAAEAWAEDKILQKKIPVLACESACIRGDIARRVANLVAKEVPFARACCAEVALVPHSTMARWVKEADQVIMVNGCFLKCVGRVLNNLVDQRKSSILTRYSITTNIRTYSIWRWYLKLSGLIPLSRLRIKYFPF